MFQPQSVAKWFSALFLALIGLGQTIARAEAPLVVFDLPYTVECRDVTPKGYEASYGRTVLEAVFRISPRLMAGREKDLRRLHYEISTEQQMPILGYLPDSQVGTEVANGVIAIRAGDYHGKLAVRYFVSPAAGDGLLQGDLQSSQVEYLQLAPKNLLLASGTLQRGFGVYYDLMPSRQDTLQKQREYACLFEVPRGWRADFVSILCRARGMKRNLVSETETDCGISMLSVGLYKQNDGEGRAAAEFLARKQQAYFDRLAQEARSRAKGNKENLLAETWTVFERVVDGPGMKAKQVDLTLGAAVQGKMSEEKGFKADLSSDSQDAGEELKQAQASLRKLNGRP